MYFSSNILASLELTCNNEVILTYNTQIIGFGAYYEDLYIYIGGVEPLLVEDTETINRVFSTIEKILEKAIVLHEEWSKE